MSSPSVALPSRIAVAGLDFAVERSASRGTIGITVDRDGSLIVNAPHDCDEAELAAFANEKRMWVYKKLAEKDLLLSHRPKKEFVSGDAGSP
jgi:predicted metal-dependent hydrolase